MLQNVVEFAGVGLGSKNLHAKNGVEILVGGNICEKLEQKDYYVYFIKHLN